MVAGQSRGYGGCASVIARAATECHGKKILYLQGGRELSAATLEQTQKRKLVSENLG